MLFLILSVARDARALQERKSALISAGFSVASASSKEEAMEKLCDGDFDLLLLCPSLGPDGYRLANAVRRYRPSIPIVAISPAEGVIRECGVHTVGSSPAEIVTAVSEILSNERNNLAARPVPTPPSGQRPSRRALAMRSVG